MRQLFSITEGIVNIGGYFAGWLVPVMMVLVLIEVFMRYVMNQPLMIADEFSAYMLVALTFLGAAYTWKEKGHVRITAMISRLPPKVVNWARLIALIFAFTFAVILSQGGYHFIALSFRFGFSSATWLHTPLQVPQMTIFIGFILLALLLITQIAKAIVDLRSGRNIDDVGEVVSK